jgi:tRNA(fMet)-specific endonuclease VapC
MAYLLDTSFLIGSVLGKAKDGLPRVLRHQQLALSFITLAELYEGAFHHTDPEGAILDLRVYLQDFALLPITDGFLLRFAELRAQLRRLGKKRSDFDLLIAATAIHHDLTLITRNVRDFEGIPDLRIVEL